MSESQAIERMVAGKGLMGSWDVSSFPILERGVE